jgi:hypothetical protein
LAERHTPAAAVVGKVLRAGGVLLNVRAAADAGG